MTRRVRSAEQLAALAERLRTVGHTLGSRDCLDAAEILLERLEPDTGVIAVSYPTLARILDSDESYLRGLGRAGAWSEIRVGTHWLRVPLPEVHCYLQRYSQKAMKRRGRTVGRPVTLPAPRGAEEAA